MTPTQKSSTMSDFPPQSSLDAHDDNTTPSRRRSRHHSVADNAHLQVLGRDGRDLPLFADPHDSLNHQEHSNINDGSSSSRGHSWWNGITRKFNRSPHDEEEPEAPFVSLVHEAGNEKKMAVSASGTADNGIATATPLQEPLATFPPQHKRSSSFSSTARAAASSILSKTRSTTSHVSSHHSPASSSSTMYSNALQEEAPPPSREEEVMNSSSFFYRDMDDVIAPKRKMSVSVLPPQERSAYRARFQQLNQEYIIEDDLELFSLDLGEEQPLTSSIIQDFSNSSLYYKQDGKVLMKLPKDKVRLVMDPELGQAGILSACITAGTNENNHNNNKECPDTEISYILTVPPDIYRKVVLELAHKHTTVCSSCFVDEDRVAIQVAVVLLIVILLLLFINVLIYPGD